VQIPNSVGCNTPLSLAARRLQARLRGCAAYVSKLFQLRPSRVRLRDSCTNNKKATNHSFCGRSSGSIPLIDILSDFDSAGFKLIFKEHGPDLCEEEGM